MKQITSILLMVLGITSLGMTQSYPATALPSDTTQLWIQEHNVEHDTVLILLQGGPEKELYKELGERTSWRYLPGYPHYTVVHLHQAQTYNKTMFAFEGLFTVEMAKKEIVHTRKMLDRAIHYFKSRNKYVVVLGHSYGAFILINHLAYGHAQANRYLISGGRLDVNERMVQDHKRGVNGAFSPDGTTYLPYEQEDLSQYTAEENKIYYVKNILKAAIGEPRYTQLLANKDLSRVSCFYATNDENVGALMDREIRFLKSKGAEVYTTHDGHYHLYRRVVDAFVAGKLSM